ncbi:MAG: hypothetical protein ACM3UU_06460 [Ignavibacteriales bacterium]
MIDFSKIFKRKDNKEECCCSDKVQTNCHSSGIGTFLIEKGLITEEQLANALSYQNENKTKKIGEILNELNLIGEEEVLSQLASYLNVDYINLDKLTFPLKIQTLFNKKTMQEKPFAPFDMSGNTVNIAISDINNVRLKKEIQDTINAHTNNLNAIYYISLPKMIRRFITNSYEKHPHDSSGILASKKKFGEYLLEKNLITKEQVDKILEYQKEFVHKRFGELLYEMKILNKEESLRELAAHEGKDYESLIDKSAQNDLMILFDLDYMIINSFVPFEREEDTVKIAINNIFDDELIQDITNLLAKNNLKTKFYISMRDSIRNFIEKEKIVS